MRKTILVIALLCYTLTSALAQKLTLTNNSCGDVFIRLHADDNTGCGPISVDESDAILVAAGSAIVYNFTGTVGTNSTVGPNFVWISTGTAGTPSGTLAGPPSTFNFFKADVWSTCAPGGWPVSGTCNYSIPANMPYDGVTISNPTCPGSSLSQYVNSTTCGTCGACTAVRVPCAPPLNWCTQINFGTNISAAFSTSGSDWSVTVY